MREFDWRALRGSMVLCVLALALAAAAAGGAIRFHDETVRGYERQKARLGSIRSPVSDHRRAEAAHRDLAAGIPRAASSRRHRRGAAAGVDRDPARDRRAPAAALAPVPDRAPDRIRGGARSRHRRLSSLLDGGASGDGAAARGRSRTAAPGARGAERGVASNRALRRWSRGAGLRAAPPTPSISPRSAICAGSRSRGPRREHERARADADRCARDRGPVPPDGSTPAPPPGGSSGPAPFPSSRRLAPGGEPVRWPACSGVRFWLALRWSIRTHRHVSGRLFSTPEQRIELDRLRDDSGSGQPAETVVDEAGPESRPEPERERPALAVTIDGVVLRGDGHRVAWVNGVETVAGATAPAGVRIDPDRTPGGRFRVRWPGGRTSAVLKPGQTIDAKGRVRDAYERRSAKGGSGTPGARAADSGTAEAGEDAAGPARSPEAAPLPAFPARLVRELSRRTRAGSAPPGTVPSGIGPAGDGQPAANSSAGRKSGE